MTEARHAMDGLDGYGRMFAAAEAARRGRGEPSWVGETRRVAFERFSALGFPSPRLEDWRFTNVAPITEVRFEAPVNGVGSFRARTALARAFVTEPSANQLVFVNGRYAPGLSRTERLPAGAVAGSLAALLRERPGLIEPHLARQASHQTQAFVALNTAFLEDGAVVYVPEGAVVDVPILIVFVSIPGDAPTVSHPRTLLIAGARSQVAVVESYIAAEGPPYLTNTVTEVVVGPEATVEHCRLQWEALEAFHVATLAAVQGRHSRLACHAVSVGGALVRNDVTACLDGEGADCLLNGLYLTAGAQHVDNHTVIDHARAHSTSLETYKGVLGGASHGVFSGRIVVRSDAQRVVARQTNKNLLLSENAVVNTKPQLEINADDVKCFHGATVGMLDDDALFYLRSRGLTRAAARAMLIHGFVTDVVSGVRIPLVRERLEATVAAWLAGRGEGEHS
jgi:Fe-S cluster assembly protein SufD